MTGKSTTKINLLIASLLLLNGFLTTSFSQTIINGTINQYGRVTSLGTDFVIIDDPVQFAQFAQDDKVLLIQMKGLRIYTSEDPSYGNQENVYGSPGKYEFLLISSVVPATRRINFTAFISNTFDVKGDVQLVKVPSYTSATVDGGVLTCAPWDSISKTGGVLAMIVGRTLTLKNNIDVSNNGFLGGAALTASPNCVNSDALNLDKYVYNSVYTSSGFKGESIVTSGWLPGPVILPVYPEYAKGKGANFTGGGGGNGRFSGGGGGANFGAGGKGGLEIGDCAPTYVRAEGGLGGKKTELTPIDGGFFLGGGGGSSTYESGTPSPGGRGGGIVFIICDTIKGNGNSIIANGEQPQKAFGNSGSGGGGGGGTIALYLKSFSTTNLIISAKGGKGGDNNSAFGEGGGGGGGRVRLSIPRPANVPDPIVSAGGKGTRPSGSSAGDGSAGLTTTDFVPVLNGFLFNFIGSSVTNNLVDSICSNVPYNLNGLINGTDPITKGTYTFLWESSTTSEVAGFGPATGVNNTRDYSPPGLITQTTWYRRIVTDNGPPVVPDISKPVKIISQPFIQNNIVGTSDIICFAQNPQTFTSQASLTGGNGIYSYKWEVSTDNSNYILPVNTNNTETYTPPPALQVTSWYRRTVTSGRCIDSSPSSVVKITVLPVIAGNNITNAPPDICFGGTFINITATTAPTLTGGDLIYRESWESSVTGTSGWGPALGIVSPGVFNPDENSAGFPGSLYYRRIVKSGSNDVCVNTSTPVLLNNYPVLTNNAIKTNTLNIPICSGSVPPRLVDSLILSGGKPGNYVYSWESKTGSLPWTPISGITSSDYQPSALTATTDFRRTVNSSACSSTSNTIRITVNSSILNNNISLLSSGTDTTICNGQNPNYLKGTVPTGSIGIYAYQWQFSTDNVTWNPVPSAGTGVNFDPPNLISTTYYRRQVISGACTVVSSATIKVTVLPLITNNIISATQTICINSIPAQLTGASLSGGDGSYRFFWEQSVNNGTTWSPAAGTNNASSGNYQPPSLNVPVKYRRRVTSGTGDCCTNVSNVVDILIYTQPSSLINAGPDTTIYSFDNIIRMVASPIFSYETGLWTVISGSGDFGNEASKNNAVVKNLSQGLNTFLWTVNNGPCKNEDPVNVTVYDIKIPEGFSPNNDPGNYNNTFIISGLDLPNQIAELSIVNSAGTEVFSTSNKNGQIWSDWDGKNSKDVEMPEGTYYYLLKLTSKSSSQVFQRSGFIILKRY